MVLILVKKSCIIEKNKRYVVKSCKRDIKGGHNMGLTIGQNIKQLRKEREMTQDELAAEIGVTPQAVSKWENDTGLPDIRQIIPLANVFRVSTDVLLGVEPPVDNAESVHEWIVRMRENIDENNTETLVHALNAFKQCPREYDDAPELRMTRLMLGYQILCAGDIKLTAKEKRDIVHECERNAHAVMYYSKNESMIQEARTWLVRLYAARGDYDRARELADQFPMDASYTAGAIHAWIDRQQANNEAEIAQRSANVSQYLTMLANEIIPLGNALGRADREEEATVVYQTLLDLIRTIYKDEEFTPPLHMEPEILYYHLARMAVKADDFDKAIHYLEKLYEYEKSNKAYYNVKNSPDTPLLSANNYSFPETDYSVKKHMLSIMERKPLKPLRSDRRFKKLMDLVENEK